MGFILLIVVLFCIEDLDVVAQSKTGFVIIDIFVAALKSNTAGSALVRIEDIAFHGTMLIHADHYHDSCKYFLHDYLRCYSFSCLMGFFKREWAARIKVASQSQ